MRVLITGGCGFLGANIASAVLRQGGELAVLDNLFRSGSEKNLEWLKTQGSFKYVRGDVRRREDLDALLKDFKPETVFHLAGQVAMTTSIKDPQLDFAINAQGTLNLLESVRANCPGAAVIYSSTNKTYGDLEWTRYREAPTRYEAPDYPNGFPETIPLEFHSPYGCSKGAADQYVLDYHRIFGLKTAVFRHSSMYGGRQFATYDQGWIGWFVQKAVEAKRGNKEPFTISGNGKQVRDVLYADDMVNLYLKAAQKMDAINGKAFNVGGGMPNSLSLLELFSMLEEELGIVLNYDRLPPRESDQKVFVADISKVGGLLDWRPEVDKREGLRRMIRWVAEGK
ncbi:MAG: NAD-dependent epimerase/dehydratase family protein [Elusimicrobiales bacterium]